MAVDRDDDGWAGVSWEEWNDHGAIRRRLGQGADPEACVGGRPLHLAARHGSPEVVAELARRVADVDAPQYGTTALWEAVMEGRADNARVLAAAGADPWRPVVGGWSPGRLSLAGPTPGLFDRPEGQPGLTGAEQEAVREITRLLAALGRRATDGLGLACVAGIGAGEAIRRLDAAPARDEDVEGVLEDPYGYEPDEVLHLVGVTEVPGGCVVAQPWSYGPSMPGVVTRLSVGTVCYGLYGNPKSGDQGSIARDGALEAWDLHPGGGGVRGDAGPEEVLASYLCTGAAVAYACAVAGLRPTDDRVIWGPPDRWVELPPGDYWTS